MQIHVCMCVHMPVCVHACGGQKITLSVILWKPSHLFLETRVSSWLEVHQLGWTGQLQESSHLCLHSAGIISMNKRSHVGSGIELRSSCL